MSRLLTVAAEPILSYHSRNFLRVSTDQVSNISYIAIVEYVVMDFLTFFAAARERIIVDGRIIYGRISLGGKMVPLPAVVPRVVYRVGFFYIMSESSIDSVSTYMAHCRAKELFWARVDMVDPFLDLNWAST